MCTYKHTYVCTSSLSLCKSVEKFMGSITSVLEGEEIRKWNGNANDENAHICI